MNTSVRVHRLFGRRREAVHCSSKNLKVKRSVAVDQSDRLISRDHWLIIDPKDFITDAKSTLTISKTIVIDLQKTLSPILPVRLCLLVRCRSSCVTRTLAHSRVSSPDVHWRATEKDKHPETHEHCFSSLIRHSRKRSIAMTIESNLDRLCSFSSSSAALF